MKARSGPVGFSLRINDPAFAAYQKKSTAWSFIFAGILALAAAAGFPIYGKASGDIEWPSSLFYGLGIGSMFIVIALIQTLRRNRDQTWEGTVAYKDSYRERSGRNRRTYRTVYVLKIDKDSGGTKQHKWRDFPGPFDYYQVGDRVRHHKGFEYYEKYDKSGDAIIMCIACMSFHDISEEICPRCRCPLLK
jgi:hypothetical protein